MGARAGAHELLGEDLFHARPLAGGEVALARAREPCGLQRGSAQIARLAATEAVLGQERVDVEVAAHVEKRGTLRDEHRNAADDAARAPLPRPS
ncbi:hypothetical protein [Nannocystis pusilla]|uniref:hypothetical protein n=1 Tax=Nannocystis pusilla TaxID=889268 RepID=UPI003B75DACF